MATTAQPVLQDDGRISVVAGAVASVHRAGHRDEAVVAAADRVALVVGHALGVPTAWRWVAGAARVLDLPVVSENKKKM